MIQRMCATCKFVYAEVEGLDEISHGWCEYHSLIERQKAKVSTTAEDDKIKTMASRIWWTSRMAMLADSQEKAWRKTLIGRIKIQASDRESVYRMWVTADLTKIYTDKMNREAHMGIGS